MYNQFEFNRYNAQQKEPKMFEGKIVESNYLAVTKLNWLYIDINSYFATIEQQINPTLRNKPVIVVAVLSDYTSAIAASYEAKLKGIRTGTKVHEAKRLCPDFICILANHKVYVEYHKRIFQEVEKHLYVDHIFSIDEAAGKLTGNQCIEENAVDIAKAIKQGIKANVGEYINCSIGIAPNRYLAKIATNLKKPDGLTVITPSDIPDKLYSVKLQGLPGVGYNTYNKLYAHGITTVEELYKVSPALLRKIWGSVSGERVWYLMRGVDLPVEKTKSSSIGHSQVLSSELRSPGKARIIAQSLILKAAHRLRKRMLYTATIILSIRTTDKQYLASKIKLEASADDITLSRLLLKSWDELIEKNTQDNKQIVIKKLSVTLCSLANKSEQLSFSDIVSSNNKPDKKQLLSESIDKLNNKYGTSVVALGKMPKENQREPIVAFGYIPGK